jgi:hypothetical protein
VNWKPGASAELALPLIYGRTPKEGVETQCEYTNNVPATQPHRGAYSAHRRRSDWEVSRLIAVGASKTGLGGE